MSTPIKSQLNPDGTRADANGNLTDLRKTRDALRPVVRDEPPPRPQTEFEKAMERARNKKGGRKTRPRSRARRRRHHTRRR